ncbi:type IV pilin protein [Endozoicomonas acroporae]|uniref:type IV pilin protein n=1 Tax=Endozoicomonas TaxID=305899 RepID=UPI000C7836B6|nr:MULTISPECIES: type IV pilin protein [Endozoicomonas]WBA79418.1 type IV pilin protein [Endozoicomonas sp. GU-1]WBA87062.1 type IV pilin protein [Endozoicomonas sp. GU-1]
MGKASGFTLIELIIAVVIVGILASIAVPSYQNAIQNGRRAEGQTALLDIAGRQEQFFLDNHQYTADLRNLGLGANPFISDEGWYSISAACGGNGDVFACSDGFVLIATPQGGQVPDGGLVLDSLGNRFGNW